ncbi:MAG: MFS transporter [Syntrophotaleaceae bacterium]
MSSPPLQNTFRRRWYIFWCLAFGYALVFFHRLCPAVVATDMMADLQAGGSLIGFLSSAYFYPYALMQLPAGLLSDSWGPRKTITLFLCIAGAGSLLLGVAPSPTWAVLGRLLVGLGVSTLFVCTLKILAEWFSVREFITMTGLLMAVGGAGSLSAASPLALLSTWIGWRLSFVLVGLLTAILAILIWCVVRDRPAELGWPSPAEHAASTDPAISLAARVRLVLTCPAFWPLAIWFFFKYGVFTAFAGLWGGPYMMHIFGLSKARAGNILSLVAFGMIVGSPLLGILSNRILKGRKPTLVLASSVLVVITAILSFATDNLPLALLGVLCFALGVFGGAIAVIGFTTARELFPSAMAGTVFGLVNLFPFAGGAFLQPLLGHILEAHGQIGPAFTVEGYRRAFLALLLSALVSLIAGLFVKETLPGEATGSSSQSDDK